MPNFEGLSPSDKIPPRARRVIECPNFSRDLHVQSPKPPEPQKAQTEATKASQVDQTVSPENITQAQVGSGSEGSRISGNSDLTLTKEEVRDVGKFLSPFNDVEIRENFAALSPEGKEFVKELARFIHAIKEVEPPSLRNATIEQRDTLFGESQKEWLSRLTPEQTTAIADYTGSAYGSINSYCRAGSAPAYILDTIDHLDAGLQNAVVPEDTIVQRVVRDTALRLFKEGEVFLNKGYTSTSLSPYYLGSNPIRLYIELPKGSQAALLPEVSSVSQEHEVLLPRGSVMQVEQIITLGDVKAALPQTDQALLADSPDTIVYMLYTGVAQQDIVKEG